MVVVLSACPGVRTAMDDPDRLGVDHLTDRIIVPERLTELPGRVMDARRAEVVPDPRTVWRLEPPRVCRTLSGLNHAAMSGSSSIA